MSTMIRADLPMSGLMLAVFISASPGAKLL
jgi:hypothetical protein